MSNLDLLQVLHDRNVLNKTDVLWWQLGFEGRRIYSEEEFNQTLQEVSYSSILDMENQRVVESRELHYKIWPKDDVPILLKDIKVGEETWPCFITVCPESHSWPRLESYMATELAFPLPINLEPHIRGIVIEQTEDFLFWNPINFGYYLGYQTMVSRRAEEFPILVSPVDDRRFYLNIIKKGWHKGKRAQKPPKKFEFQEEGFQLVPYYEFSPSGRDVTIYPAPLFEGRLDFPIVIRSNTEGRIPEILGTGYCVGEQANYWTLDARQQRMAKKSLIERLGDLSR